MPYGTIAADTVQSSTGNTAPLFYDGNGVQIGQLCKSWVNFNGTLTTPIAARASFNISSITKNGGGNYTVNFTNALIDANFGAVVGAGRGSSSTSVYGILPQDSAPTISTIRVVTAINSTTPQDADYCSVSAFR